MNKGKRCRIEKIKVVDALSSGLCWSCVPETRIPCLERIFGKDKL
jgi:hypothetical protein